MTLILSLIWLLSMNGLNANSNTISDIDPIDYLQSMNVSFHEDCSLSFKLNMIGISKLYEIISTNIYLKQSILYWTHSHIFKLIDSSFLYDIDQYTVDFWNEYYLHLLFISNETQNTMSLTIDICVSQLEIEQIIETELQNDGDEIAAFIRYKLIDHIETYYTEITINNLYIDIIIISPISTTDTILIAADTTTNNDTESNNNISTIIESNDKNDYVFTERMIYIAIIGICVIIMALIMIVFCVLCIKQKTDKRLEKAIKDIKTSQNNKNNSNDVVMGDIDFAGSDIISIDPMGIPRMSPSHLMSIDTGLNRENVLLSDDEGTDSIKIQRNKLALMPSNEDININDRNKKKVYKEPELADIEELKVGHSLNIDDMSSDAASSEANNVFLDDEYKTQSLHSGRSSNRLKRNKNDEINVLYHNLPITHSKSMHSPNHKKNLKKIRDDMVYQYDNNAVMSPVTSKMNKKQQRKSLHQPQLRRYRNKQQYKQQYKHQKQQRHSIVNTLHRKQYAKRKLEDEQKVKNKQKQNRSQSKPNINNNSSYSNPPNIKHKNNKKNKKPRFRKQGSQPNLYRKRQRNRYSHPSLQSQPGNYDNCYLSNSRDSNSSGSAKSQKIIQHNNNNNNNNNTFSVKPNNLNQSNSMRNLRQFAIKKKLKKRHRRKSKNKSLNVHSNANAINAANNNKHNPFIQSVDVDAINFDMNGGINVNINNLKDLDPPIPNPENINEDISNIINLNQWESQSESSSDNIDCNTPTTQGPPSQISQISQISQLEGVKEKQSSINNSDAQSNNDDDDDDDYDDDNSSISTLKSQDKYQGFKPNKNNERVNVYKVLKLNQKRVTLTQKIPPNALNIQIPPPPKEAEQNKLDKIYKKQIPEMPIKPPLQYKRDPTVHIHLGSNHKIYDDSITNHMFEDRITDDEDSMNHNNNNNNNNNYADDHDDDINTDDEQEEEEEDNGEGDTFKFDALSMLALGNASSLTLSQRSALQSNFSSHQQPNF